MGELGMRAFTKRGGNELGNASGTLVCAQVTEALFGAFASSFLLMSLASEADGTNP